MEMKELLQLMESANTKPMQIAKRSLTESDSYNDPRWDKYAQFMPPSGPSDRLVGELFRAAAKINHDYYNNGFGNNWSEAAAFLMNHLSFSSEVERMFLEYGLGKVVSSFNDELDAVVEDMVQTVLNALDQIDPEIPNDTDMWKTDISRYNFIEWEDDEEDQWEESVETDRPLSEDQDVVMEFEETIEQIAELTQHALDMLPRGIIRDRARSYWYGHIMSALGSDEYGSGSATTMRDTWEELQNSDEDEY